MSTHTNTRYDRIGAERAVLARKVLLADLLVSLAVIGTVYFLYRRQLISFEYPLIIVLAIGVSCFFSARFALSLVSNTYKTSRFKIKSISNEIKGLRSRALALYESKAKRPKGRHFKSHYDLSGSNFVDFENALAVGMWHEQKEVWVTALCRDEKVMHVTATVGSKFRCRPSDTLSSWSKNARRLGCSEIRQYHNHPINTNFTRPSPEDIIGSQSCERILRESSINFKSYVVFWNKILEYKILQYRGDGTYEIVRYFDASANQALNADRTEF